MTLAVPTHITILRVLVNFIPGFLQMTRVRFENQIIREVSKLRTGVVSKIVDRSTLGAFPIYYAAC